MPNWKNPRALEADRCCYPRCRDSSAIVYLSGATPVNPTYDVTVCDDHHEDFLAEFRTPEED